MFIQNAKEIRQEKQRRKEIAREERIQEKLDEEEQFREEERAAVQKAREEEQEKKRGEKQAEAEKASQRRRSQRLRENLNHKYTQIAWYVVITAVILYILLKILDHLGEIGSAIGAGLGWMSVLLKPLVIGFAIAYLLYPLDNFFQRQLLKIPWFRKKRFSARGLAVGMTAILVAGILAVSLSAIVSTVTRELTVFHVDDIDRLLSSLQSSMNSFYNSVIRVMRNFSISSDQLTEYLEPLQTAVVDWAGDLAKSVAGGVRHLPATLSTTIFAIIFGVYFQLDGEGLKKYWSHTLKAITTWNAYNNIRNFFRDADSVFSGYIRGQLVDATFMAVVVSISLSLVGIRYAIVIGILTGIGNLIPYVGPFVAYGSTIFVSLLRWNPRKLIIALIVLFIIQTIDGNVINPKFLSNAIKIHPLLVIASLIIGSAIGGFLGMLLAVPCGALAKIYFEKLISYIIRRRKLELPDE
ncbi:MAG: AI-2E family transporter [Lachnospiraceae bacterium]|nr:AI-2E family transporter [Lachnospiraceae bacterium]